MKEKRKNASVSKGSGLRYLAIAGIAFGLAGAWSYWYFSLQQEQADRQLAQGQRLEDLGRRTQERFLVEEEKLDGLLVRIRSELRVDGDWAQQEPEKPRRELRGGDTPGLPAGEDDGTRPKEVAIQLGKGVGFDRWRSVRANLKRGLRARPDLESFDLVVTDQAGLTALRVRRKGNEFVEEIEDPRASKGVAKAIWYADEVRRAVASNGRRVERSALSPSAESAADKTTMRVALALHDPSELIQGVLVATLDLAPLADLLAGLSGAEIDARVVTLEGSRLDTLASAEKSSETGNADDASTVMGAERDAIFVQRILAPDRTEKTFAADGFLVDGMALMQADGRASEAILLMEQRLPPNDWITHFSAPKGMGLIALTLLAVLAVSSLIRRGRFASASASASAKPDHSQEEAPPHANTQPRDGNASTDLTGTESNEVGETDSAEADTSGLVLGRERINLREWLGDIRGCLEREAATRGLALNLQCDRSLPQSIEQDPGWLGGLVIAMGQEALDATAEERVLLRVREDAHEVLRFELDAGPVSLSPVRGMRSVAEELGGHFETDANGGFAFLMPMKVR